MKQVKKVTSQASGVAGVLFVIIFNVFFVVGTATRVFSQQEQENKITVLSKQILEAKNKEELYIYFEELKGLYLADNKYNDFVQYLESLGAKQKTLELFADYYIALTRYSQLKYLEDKQIWDEYFSEGNNYRQGLVESAKKVINETSSKDKLNIYARLLLWQFHKDQQDVFAEDALSSLVSSVLEYAQSTGASMLIKEIADKLSSYAEKAKARQLYNAYVERITFSGTKTEELKNEAASFYKNGNLELAEAVYDVYIERLAKEIPKEKLIPVLIDIAKLFVYDDFRPGDTHYGEKLFKKIEETGGKDAFSQELLYLRAYNLEKAKEYNSAKDLYISLISRYPNAPFVEQVIFKTGMIYAYALRDILNAKAYFDKLIQKPQVSAVTPWTLSSLYQLGLLSQWENNIIAAKEYYNKLINASGESLPESLKLAKERLKEIEEAKPIEYNLKSFLDAAFKEEHNNLDMTKIELKAHPYQARVFEAVNISVTVYASESGCLQTETQYLWSGDLGNINPSTNPGVFNTTYIEPGVKVINLILVSPSGIIERSFDLIDVK